MAAAGLARTLWLTVLLLAVAGAAAVTVGVTASWVGGGLLGAALVSLALLVPALRRYDARTAAPHQPSGRASGIEGVV